MTVQEFVSREKERAGQNGPVYPSRDGKFAKNKLCAGERRESAVEGTTGSLGVTAGTSDPKDSAGSWSRHTHTHTHTTRLLFVPGSSFFSLARSLFCSPLSTPPPGRLSKSCTPPVPPARGWETPGAWPRAELRMRPSSSAAAERTAWSLLRALPRSLSPTSFPPLPLPPLLWQWEEDEREAAAAVIDTTVIDALTEGMRRESGTQRRERGNITHCSTNERTEARRTRKSCGFPKYM
ncbi:uncharacterized protein LOC113894793 [Bos indicus x Bos taurus]|uniref:uncharacterized protein LOC113894793 n=1 Tax=Bos indicus x Bos taurus TaxID=30522 RepID=UPI000F7D25DE|nr:uncharacterized protein LOC113894793 [Bos indicus x Bos taurus]XP_061277192.1 uncharacterized protein LOC133250039 [Bos javanicus]